MNVEVERLPESQVLLDISTDEQEFTKAMDKAYRKVVQQVRLPGFRPGKAPRVIIEQMLGREVIVEQADRDLLDPLYQQALEQEALNPVGEPEVEIYQTEPLAFKVTVQVYPTVDPGDYQGVRAEPRPVAITDERVEETLTNLRDSRSPWAEPAEARAVKEGDRVTVDVTVREADSDEPYREPLNDSVYTLGKDNLFQELHDTILGMAIGDERTVDISFDEENQGVEAGMRGKTMNYTVSLKKVEEQEPLALDDEFAKTATDGRLETLEHLRNDIRKELLQTERQQARNEIGSDVVNQIGDNATLELPSVMIDKQVDSDIENMRNHLGQQHNQTLEAHLRAEEKTLEELREELRPEAIRRLRNSLVLREIATREGVSVSPQDIDAEIDRMIGTSETSEQMRQFYSSNYIRNMLETELFERKLMDRIIDIATEGRGPTDPPEEPEAETPVATAEADEAGIVTGETAVSDEAETPEEVAEALEVGESLPMDEDETTTVTTTEDESSNEPTAG